MLKFFILLFVVKLTLFPCIINGECCGRQKLYFQRVDAKSRCNDFGGLIPMNEVISLYPYIIPASYESSINCEISVCGDGKKPQNKKIYCGQGSCNIFGCNCDGGCIPGNALKNFKALYENKVRNVKM